MSGTGQAVLCVYHATEVQSWNVFFPFFFFFFYPFEHWKLYYDDMHVLVWLCASQCATFLYQTHLRACCVPGSRLSALHVLAQCITRKMYFYLTDRT